MGSPLRVLLVEDSEDDALLILRELQKGGYDPVWKRVDTPGAMADELERESWDIIISDYVMPRCNGLDALKLLQAKGLDLPFIIISGRASEEALVGAMKAGAHDYILKNNLARLVAAVERELREAEERRERKKAEEALRKSEERFRIAAESGNDLIWEWDILKGKLDWFDKIDELLGYAPLEFPRTIEAWEGILHPDDHDRVMDSLEKHLKLGTSYSEEYRVRRKDGTLRYWTDRGTALWDEKGQAYRMIGACSDITERKQAAESLKDTLTQLNTLIEAIPDVVFLKDVQGNNLVVNRAFEKLLGLDRDKIIGKTDDQILPAELAEQCRKGDEEVFQECKVKRAEEEMIDREGRKIFFETVKSPVKDDQGKVKGLIGTMRDITERKRAEGALRESEREAQRLAKENAIMAEIGRIISSTLDINVVYERFAQEARKLIEFDRISVNTINRQENTFTIPYVWGIAVEGRQPKNIISLIGSPPGEVFKTRSSLLIQSEDKDEIATRLPGYFPTFQVGLLSALFVPLIVQDEVTGSLSFLSKKSNAYTDRDRKLAETIGYQVAGAIANAQLFAERKLAEEALLISEEVARRMAHENAIVAEIGRIISSTPNIEDIYEGFAQETRKLIPSDYIAIAIIDHEKGTFHNAYISGDVIPGRGRMEVVSLAGSFTEQVVRSRSIQLIQTEDADEVAGRFPKLLPFSRRGVRSFLAVPLIANDRVLGALHVYSIRSKAYKEADANLAERIAAQIAGAIATAQLLTEGKKAEEVLREAEEKYRLLFETSTNAILIRDGEGIIRLANPTAIETLKASRPDEIIGKAYLDFVHPEDRPGSIDRIQRQIKAAQGEPGIDPARIVAPLREHRLLTVDGETISVESTGIAFRHQGQAWIQGIFRNISERKQAEEAVRKERDKAQKYLDVAGVILVVIEGNQRVSLINRKGCEVLGYKEEDIIGANWFDRFLPESDRERVKATFLKLMAGEIEQAGYFENPVLTKSGEEKIIAWRNTVLKDQAGNIIGTLSSGEDITERKRVEEVLHGQFHLMQQLLDAIPTPIFYKDLQGIYLGCNAAYAKFMGFAKEQIVGKTVYEVFPQDLADIYHEADMALFQQPGVQIYETSFLHADGSRHNVVINKATYVDTHGRVAGLVGVLLDITERRRAEELLRRSEERFRSLIENSSDMILEVDKDANISYVSPSGERVLGYKPESMIGKKGLEFVHPDDAQKTIEASNFIIRNPGVIRTMEYRLRHFDGSWRILQSIGRANREDGRNAGIVVNSRDITEQKSLENQLAQAQKLEAIGSLAAGIAHEINTPTQYVGDNTRFFNDAFKDLIRLLGKYEQLLSGLKAGEGVDEIVQEVETTVREIDFAYLAEEVPRAIQQTLEGVERVRNIVQAMKEFSHPGTKEKTFINLNKAIQDTITVARNEWKYVAEMVTDLEPSLPLVSCLPGEFNQVILNMITNAAHAIADVVGDGSGGKGTITVSTRQDGSWAEIRVGDTGTGIPENIRSRIFDPFFTTKMVGKGTGQGLTISHAVIVDKHGGTVHFETEVGQGTTFIIRLPIGNLGS